MKKHASLLLCVLCLMLASVLHYVILSQAVPAAAEYSRRPESVAVEEPSSLAAEHSLFNGHV